MQFFFESLPDKKCDQQHLKYLREGIQHGGEYQFGIFSLIDEPQGFWKQGKNLRAQKKKKSN